MTKRPTYRVKVDKHDVPRAATDGGRRQGSALQQNPLANFLPALVLVPDKCAVRALQSLCNFSHKAFPMTVSRMRAAALCALLAPALAVAQDQQGQPPTPQVVRSVSTPLQIERLGALEFPWGMALLPDGRVLVTEKPGRLRIFVDGKLSEPLAGVPKAFYRPPKDQGGLLDIAVDPKFASNGFVYLSFVEAAEMQAPDQSDTGDTRFRNLDTSDTVLRGGAVARGRLDGNQLRDVQVIWRQVPKTVGRGHFGHRLVFAPDGNLFITSGERMRFEPAQ